MASGVPTVFLGLINHMRHRRPNSKTLGRIVSGGRPSRAR